MSADVVIVSGYLIRCPLGGYAWQILHYLAGLRALGFRPYFYEDTSVFLDCFDPRTGNMTDDPTTGLAIAGDFFARFGFERHWVYRDHARSRTYGLSEEQRAALLAEARVIISLAGVNRLPPRPQQRRVFIDLDPAFTQIRAANGERMMVELLAEHDAHFTLGERIGTPSCRVPTGGLTWHPTRQPVALELWDAPDAPTAAPFTTIGRWDERNREAEFAGERYSWRKRVEWLKFVALPARTGERFVVAMDVAKLPDDLALLERHGWHVADPMAVSADPLRYRRFIHDSKGEFTVAKDLNIRLATGWFSDRGACYLAAGRPVVTQDTGFDQFLPTGAGLFSCRTPDEATAAIRAVADDYAHHAAAARRIAREYFAAGQVLRELLDRVG